MSLERNREKKRMENSPWKESLGIMSIKRIDVGMTKSIGYDFDSNLSRLWWGNL